MFLIQSSPKVFIAKPLRHGYPRPYSAWTNQSARDQTLEHIYLSPPRPHLHLGNPAPLRNRKNTEALQLRVICELYKLYVWNICKYCDHLTFSIDLKKQTCSRGCKPVCLTNGGSCFNVFQPQISSRAGFHNLKRNHCWRDDKKQRSKLQYSYLGTNVQIMWTVPIQYPVVGVVNKHSLKKSTLNQWSRMSIFYIHRCVQYNIVMALPWLPCLLGNPRLRPIRSTDVTHAELWRDAVVFRHPEACGRPGDVELENHISKNSSRKIAGYIDEWWYTWASLLELDVNNPNQVERVLSKRRKSIYSYLRRRLSKINTGNKLKFEDSVWPCVARGTTTITREQQERGILSGSSNELVLAVGGSEITKTSWGKFRLHFRSKLLQGS